MGVLAQIFLASGILCLCATWHIFILIELVKRIKSYAEKPQLQSNKYFKLTILIFLGILFSHVVQFYFWAGSYWALGALPDFADSLYFSMVTYTTLGYGDIVLGSDLRIFAAIESVTGVLVFGISTAFLVGYFSELLKDSS